MNKRISYRKISRSANIFSPMASAVITGFTLINPALLAVPVVCSVISEICNYFESESTESRLKSMQNAIEFRQIELQEFTERLNHLDEHGVYVVRNNLKHLCLSALPETVELFNQALINYIMNENQSMAEEACEIIRQLNANDVLLLKQVKSYLLNGDREIYKQKETESVVPREIRKNEEVSEDQVPTGSYKSIKWINRNELHGNNTIMWADFISILDLATSVDMGSLLNYECRNDKGESVLNLAYLARSILKLQNLGVLQTNFLTTVGTISSNNIDRFHITLFGQTILKYIVLSPIITA